jgi:predicted enzyme related to lactoylglutathione lyase
VSSAAVAQSPGHGAGSNLFPPLSIGGWLRRQWQGRVSVPLLLPTISLEITMANPFVHVELSTNDVPAAKAFYGKLFDWKLEDVPMPNGAYTMIQVGTGTGGGLMQQQIPGAPSSWLAYVEVDDIAAATKKAKALGATVMKDVTEVMGMGWLSIIVDPTGAALGLRKAKL